MLLQLIIICTIKKRRGSPTIHDNRDFKPVITTRIAEILPLSVVTAADKGYDNSEDNRLLLAREELYVFSIIPETLWDFYFNEDDEIKNNYNNDGIFENKVVTKPRSFVKLLISLNCIVSFSFDDPLLS